MYIKMDNQQLSNFISNESVQVLLSGRLGDGSFVEGAQQASAFTSNCIHKEYLQFKAQILEREFRLTKSKCINRGYKANLIYNIRTYMYPEIYQVSKLPIDEIVNGLDDLGAAMWFYDDGTRHKDKNFYQLSTHAFSKEIQEDVFIPALLNKWGIKAKLTIERKKDGREFNYLSITKYGGANIIHELLSKLPFECYNYKLWSSETIRLWSKFQEELKRREKMNILTENRHYASIWKQVSKSQIHSFKI